MSDIPERKEEPIDWDEVDREAEAYLAKCMAYDRQIAEERKTKSPVYDLRAASERVSAFAAENGIETQMLTLKP